MILLVAYDIQNNKYRKKIADHLIYMGMHRIQKSVFIGHISRYDSKQMVAWLDNIYETVLNKKVDKIYWQKIPKSSIKKSNFKNNIQTDSIIELLENPAVVIY